MPPSGVNDSARQMMAATRTWYETAEWINLGYTPTYIGATSFSLVGDKTSEFQVGRRVKAYGTTPFTIYGVIVTSAYTSLTTVTVTWDSGSLNSTLTTVWISINSVTNPSISTSMVSGLVSQPFSDANALIKGSSDATKLARFEVDGLTTATTRVYTLQDRNGTLADDTDLATKAATATTISAAGLATGGGSLASNRTITVTAATQSDMETATSTTTAVTPAVVKNHPGTGKAWVKFAGSDGSISASYNVTSVTKNGTGDYTVNFTTAFSSANYAAVVTAETDDGTFLRPAGIKNGGQAAGSLNVITENYGGTNTNATAVSVICMGDQ